MQVSVLQSQLRLDLDEIVPVVRDAFSSLFANRSRQLNVSTLERTLSEALARFEITVDNIIDKDAIHAVNCMIEAECIYESADTLPMIAIKIATPTRRLSVTNKFKQHFVFHFMQVLCHELIHRYQYIFRASRFGRTNNDRIYQTAYAARDKLHQKDQQYHGSIDEIEAYAHEAVQTIWRHYADLRNANSSEIVKMIKTLMREQTIEQLYQKHCALHYYKYAFGTDFRQSALRTFLRKAKLWAEHGEMISL